MSLLRSEMSSMPMQSFALLMEMMQYDRKERIASPKSNPRVRSIGSGQDFSVEHPVETHEGDVPRITSSCHPSLTASSR